MDRDMLITMYSNNPDIQGAIKKGQWTHGLCGCFDNLGMCVIAYFVPCVSWGQTSSELGKSCCLYGGLFYFIPFLNCYLVAKQRGEIRDIRGIPGSFCGDCITCGCCSLCSLVQEEQEVQEIKRDIIVELSRRQGQTVAYGVVAPNMVVAQGVGIQTQYQGQHAPPPPYQGYPAQNPPQETKGGFHNPEYLDQKVERI